MSDNLQDRGPQDRSRISLSEDWEIRYWCDQLSCTELELKEAVKTVGNNAEAVREAIRSKP